MSEEREWTNISDSEGLNLARLTQHVLVKGVQAGSVVGCAFVAPFTVYRAFRNKEVVDFTRLARRQVVSMGVLSAISCSMMICMYMGWKNRALGVQDRVYRIHYNKGQNQVDKTTYASFLGSFAPALLLSRKLIFSLGLTSPAITGGMVYYMLTKETHSDQ